MMNAEETFITIIQDFSALIQYLSLGRFLYIPKLYIYIFVIILQNDKLKAALE
jgi:hypothetical protein